MRPFRIARPSHPFGPRDAAARRALAECRAAARRARQARERTFAPLLRRLRREGLEAAAVEVETVARFGKVTTRAHDADLERVLLLRAATDLAKLVGTFTPRQGEALEAFRTAAVAWAEANPPPPSGSPSGSERAPGCPLAMESL